MKLLINLRGVYSPQALGFVHQQALEEMVEKVIAQSVVGKGRDIAVIAETVSE